MADTDTAKPEIVIIRRKSGDEGAAVKGGAWKIAYADFVTAMMAFFLVMWLINASNEATRAQVASYFNPIKLTDSSTGEKGVSSPKDANHEARAETSPAVGEIRAASERQAEMELLADPAGTLEKIAGGPGGASHSGSEGQSREDSGSSMEADIALAPGLGDPFDPRSWEEADAAKPAAVKTETLEKKTQESPAEAREKKQPEPVAAKSSSEAAKVEKDEARLPQENTAEHAAPKTEAEGQMEPVRAGMPDADVIRQRVDAAIRAAGLNGIGQIEIRQVADGALISLTDRHDRVMFQTGSAEPDPDAIRLIEAIAAAIAGQPGSIIVRGHTDAKPFRRKTYDNWQLSTARAHMTQYMLIRGGLDPARIRRIEGLADRDPLNADDPNAPENRRIEILLAIAP